CRRDDRHDCRAPMPLCQRSRHARMAHLIAPRPLDCTRQLGWRAPRAKLVAEPLERDHARRLEPRHLREMLASCPRRGGRTPPLGEAFGPAPCAVVRLTALDHREPTALWSLHEAVRRDRAVAEQLTVLVLQDLRSLRPRAWRDGRPLALDIVAAITR